jgi:phosphatidylserine/phosphatidylglycerophosphate/cardiolipin synthase-like enzyme
VIPPHGAEFLENPRDIRRAVRDLVRRAKRMDLAIAFVGQDWRDAIADFRGRLWVVCWLSSTNTNPYAVQQMMREDRVEVRQRDVMHAKVYLARAVGAVVGSANLSRRALDSADVSGQYDAAVLLRDAANRSAIGQRETEFSVQAEVLSEGH